MGGFLETYLDDHPNIKSSDDIEEEIKGLTGEERIKKRNRLAAQASRDRTKYETEWLKKNLFTLLDRLHNLKISHQS